ncbi:keratin-associated protein 5-3-like [Dendronephthya gigantea]|uniref:keratin-associated protein 5-3-like n=1 Tax=Dendronephthya gigantea TaxID=151771 RepID=UPI00106943BC|nr:keratin-associated protein 5-3-like [Dendronephthya gigantea]
MSFVSMTFLFLLNAMYMGQFGLVLGQTTCTSNSNCVSSYSICCKGYVHQGYGYTSSKCRYGSNCVGRYCTTDGDCGGKNECCKSNKCTTSGCSNCNSNYNCALFEYCCKQRYYYDKHVCRRSCVGETCHSNSDCGGLSEYCNSNKKCALPCSSNSGCSGSTYCCKRGSYTNVCQSSCVGETCSYDSDCGGPGESCRFYKCKKSSTTTCSSNLGCSGSTYCCKRGIYTNVCQSSCVGETCYSDSDCGGPGESCRSYKCKKSSTTTASWVVPVIVVGVILFIIVFAVIPAYRCYRGSSQRGRVVRQRVPQNAIAIVAVENTQVQTSAPPPPVCNAPPPPYYNQGGYCPSSQPNQFPPPPPKY